MTRKPLDDHLRDHFAEPEPSPELLERLTRMAVLRDDAAPSRGRRGPLLAAAALAACVLAWFALPLAGGAPTTASVAQEIVRNHLKAEEAEVVLASFAEVNAALPRLDFTVRDSARLARGSAVRAKYCSLGGQVALQAALDTAEAGRTTVYQTRESERLANVEAGTVSALGLDVELWREQGVLFGRVASP